jgi:putative flippase GtrA
MIDITSANDGVDLGIYDTQAPKAGNILSVQLGSLEYAQELGIDLDFFLSDQFSFQNESFKSYLISTLANAGISVASLIDTVFPLYEKYVFNISPEDASTGLIAR